MTSPLEAQALTVDRAALAGPWQGATLDAPLPVPLDRADRLGDWAPGPRMQVCEQAVLEGLHFSAGRAAVELRFTPLDRRGARARTLVSLSRPTLDIFQKQTRLVYDYAELRDDRGAEVLAQIGGAGAFFAAIAGLSAHRHRYTAELLDLTLSVASHVQQRFKHAFAVPRPVLRSPQIQPMIPTPGHAAWPSGHATEAYAIATVLVALLPQGRKLREQLERLAARVAVNRTVAGLHYPVDSAVGRLLGVAVGEFVIARCLGRGVPQRDFIGGRFQHRDGSALDFDPRVPLTGDALGYYRQSRSAPTVPASALLRYIWSRARAECQPVE